MTLEVTDFYFSIDAFWRSGDLCELYCPEEEIIRDYPCYRYLTSEERIYMIILYFIVGLFDIVNCYLYNIIIKFSTDLVVID